MNKYLTRYFIQNIKAISCHEIITMINRQHIIFSELMCFAIFKKWSSQSRGRQKQGRHFTLCLFLCEPMVISHWRITNTVWSFTKGNIKQEIYRWMHLYMMQKNTTKYNSKTNSLNECGAGGRDNIGICYHGCLWFGSPSRVCGSSKVTVWTVL